MLGTELRALESSKWSNADLKFLELHPAGRESWPSQVPHLPKNVPFSQCTSFLTVPALPTEVPTVGSVFTLLGEDGVLGQWP